MCLSIRTSKIMNFPYVPNGKLMVLGVPIFKHIRASTFMKKQKINYRKLVN